MRLLKFPTSGKVQQRKSKSHGFYVMSIVALAGLSGCLKPDHDLAAIQSQVQDLRLDGIEASDTAVVLGDGYGAALRGAVARGAAYRAAVAREAASLAAIDVSSAGQKLQASLNSRLGLISESGTGGNRTTSGASGGITLSKLLFDGGASDAAISQAMARAVAAGADVQIAANETALAAAQAWADLWQADQRLDLLADRLQRLDGSLAQMQRMAGLGLMDRSALDNLRRQAAALRQEQTQIHSQRTEAAARFARYFGAAPETVAAPADVGGRPKVDGWKTSPALTRNAADVVMAQAQLAEAQAAFSPTARAQAGVTAPVKRDETTDTAIGLVMEFTLGDGGRRQAQLKAAQDGLVAAKAQLADGRAALQAEFAATWAQLQAIEAAKPDLAEEIRLAAAEAKTARSQIQTGQANLRQLVEAELAHYRAEDRMITLQAQAHIAQLTAHAISGDLARQIGAVK